MGNFVSLATSCPVASADPQDYSTSINQEPKLSPTPTRPASSARIQRCTLTASLTSHARRLTKRLCRLTGTGGIRLSDVEEGLLPPDKTATAAQAAHFSAPGILIPTTSSARRRALLVGIAYHGELLHTHQDVDRYRDVLIAAYGYRPEDITVLKDDPVFDDRLQPTRENLLRELRNLVADAAAGDQFTFLFSGHSNQQPLNDLSEEDFVDEYLITIDDEVIIDSELNDILVKPLPTSSSLFALFDSGTQLDTPPYHRNTVFVPWCSKGKRRTNSLQNVTVRRNAAFVQDPFPGPAPFTPPTFSSILAQSKLAERMRPVLYVFVSTPLSTDGRITPAPMENSARHLRDSSVPPSAQVCASPQSILPSSGGCVSDPNANAPTVVSLAACSDDQLSREAYEGSLIRAVCSFLGKNHPPLYKDLMTHIHFTLHTTSRQLHEWTRTEKTKAKESSPQIVKDEQADLCSEKPSSTQAETFEGEMDKFQTRLACI